ncbi:PHAX [Acanthosepion pharaonis]|uniref:Phosphorylated adapter RNA export protein n=1 Tax=Acanthosepion pharaonis TaxID=158019 RepID=A0A812C232_ACAPH|nr:PHAX [Sepia pharaonis]
MGRKKTLELAYITEDIEDSGGMLTNNGDRRRTPGGVFFQILKTDPSFTKEKMKAVFGDEMKKEAKRKKKLRAKRIKLSLQKKKNISAEDEDAMEMENAADASQSIGEHQSKNDCLDDCDDENSKDASRGSSEASNCPDPETMDLSDLLKHHVERRRVEEEEEEEEEKKKAAAEHKEERIENQSAEMQPKESLPFLEPDICLDDESEMTFDL